MESNKIIRLQLNKSIWGSLCITKVQVVWEISSSHPLESFCVVSVIFSCASRHLMRAIVCFLQQIWQFRMWQQWIGHSHQRISICACSGLCALFFDALTRPERGNLLQSMLLISQVFPSQSSQWDWYLCQSWVLTSWCRGLVTTVEPTQLLSADIRAFFLPLAPFPPPLFSAAEGGRYRISEALRLFPRPCFQQVRKQGRGKRHGSPLIYHFR